MKPSPGGLAARAAHRVGQTLCSKWRINRLLGAGGFAAVYAATHRTGKRVAIKVLHPETAASPDIAARFLREAYVANSIDHPGVVSVADDDVTDDGAPFLVMDLLDGETLEARRKVAGGRLPAREVAALADQALDVLIAAHDKGIVHRDIKPENLFIGHDGRVRVLDFGIARAFERTDSAAATALGSTMGSPAFMPPEQARGRWDLVDAQSDLWSLGAAMFMLLAGRPVHVLGTLNETLISAATEPAPSIGHVVSDLPEGLVKVIDRALAFDKADRWPDARVLRSALRLALRGAGNEEATLELDRSPPEPAEPAAPEAATLVLAGASAAAAAGHTDAGASRPSASGPSVGGTGPNAGAGRSSRWAVLVLLAIVIAVAAVAAALLGRARPFPASGGLPEPPAETVASSEPARPLASSTAPAPEVGSAIATAPVEVVPARAVPASAAPSAPAPAPARDPFAERGAAPPAAGGSPSGAPRAKAAPPAVGPKDPFDKRQ